MGESKEMSLSVSIKDDLELISNPIMKYDENLTINLKAIISNRVFKRNRQSKIVEIVFDKEAGSTSSSKSVRVLKFFKSTLRRIELYIDISSLRNPTHRLTILIELFNSKIFKR